jgi:hypothetical protein
VVGVYAFWKYYIGCWHMGAISCVFLMWGYQHIIAMVIPNTVVLPVMDYVTLISNNKANVQYMNQSQFTEAIEDDWSNMYTERMKLPQYAKFNYRIKQIMGDYYYEEMTMEEAKKMMFIKPESDDKVLRNQQDIDDYIRDNMNERMPLDGPLVRIYYQRYEPEEENKDRPEGEKVKALQLWKCHHAFCDGVSVTSMVLAASKEYNRSYFLKSNDASFFEKLFLRCLTPFYIPKMIVQALLSRADSNSLVANKGPLTGKINISSAPPINLVALKVVTKKLKITVNDILLCALTTSLSKIFKENNEKVDNVTLMIPANIRFKFYAERKDVRLENKFAAIPLSVPITDTMEKAYGEIKRASAALKGSFGLIYAYYAISFWSAQILPRWVMSN